MAIIIPKKGQKTSWIREFEVDGDTEKYSTPTAPILKPVLPQTSNFGIANINPKEYIQVGMNGLDGNPVAISAYELQGSNDKTYEGAHQFLINQRLYMPTPAIFMEHFSNVLAAQKGIRTLNYADGSQVSDSEVKEMYKHLTKNHKDIFANGNPGAWTWLNAKFVRGKGCLILDLETITGLNVDGTLKVTPEPLEECMDRETFVLPNFNRQGLPKFADVSQKYRAGENICFYAPVSGCVARFNANSDWAGLSCNRGPTNSNPALGVFACAEGTASQKN